MGLGKLCITLAKSRCVPNRLSREARAAGRSRRYDAKARNKARDRLGRNPLGHKPFGRIALSNGAVHRHRYGLPHISARCIPNGIVRDRPELCRASLAGSKSMDTV